jgi:hypothetical protein
MASSINIGFTGQDFSLLLKIKCDRIDAKKYDTSFFEAVFKHSCIAITIQA